MCGCRGVHSGRNWCAHEHTASICVTRRHGGGARRKTHRHFDERAGGAGGGAGLAPPRGDGCAPPLEALEPWRPASLRDGAASPSESESGGGAWHGQFLHQDSPYEEHPVAEFMECSLIWGTFTPLEVRTWPGARPNEGLGGETSRVAIERQDQISRGCEDTYIAMRCRRPKVCYRCHCCGCLSLHVVLSIPAIDRKLVRPRACNYTCRTARGQTDCHRGARSFPRAPPAAAWARSASALASAGRSAVAPVFPPREMLTGRRSSRSMEYLSSFCTPVRCSYS